MRGGTLIVLFHLWSWLFDLVILSWRCWCFVVSMLMMGCVLDFCTYWSWLTIVGCFDVEMLAFCCIYVGVG